MMEQQVYVITDESGGRFLCKNSNGRYFGYPNYPKDIIQYPSEAVAENIIRNVGESLEFWGTCKKVVRPYLVTFRELVRCSSMTPEGNCKFCKQRAHEDRH